MYNKNIQSKLLYKPNVLSQYIQATLYIKIIENHKIPSTLNKPKLNNNKFIQP